MSSTKPNEVHDLSQKTGLGVCGWVESSVSEKLPMQYENHTTQGSLKAE